MKKRQACIYDFADPRYPRGEEARVEGAGQRMGLSGPASPIPGASSGEPKASAIRSSHQHAVEGAGRKRCQKGKNCGGACIEQHDLCLLDFPEPVQAEITKMIDYITKTAAKQGRAIEPGSERERELHQRAIQVGRHLTYPSPSKGMGFGTSTHGQSLVLSPSEIRHLKENAHRIGDADFNEDVKKAWQKHVQSKGVALPREDLELIYGALPQAAKDQINKGGSPGKNNFYGVDKNGNEVTNAPGGSRERGLAVLDMYFRQGGTDAYKWNSSHVYSPMDLDVEHVRPIAKGGLDHPDNWVLARSGAQRFRNNTDLQKFIDSLPNPDDKAAMRQYYSQEATRLQGNKAAKSTFGTIRDNLANMSDAEFLKQVPVNKGMKYVFVDPLTGKADAFFQQTGLDHPNPPQPRTKITQPAGFSKAYGLVRKNSDHLSEQVRDETRQLWNKEWMTGKISTQDLVDKWINIYKSKLSPEAFALVEPDMIKSGQTLLKSYPEGSPSYTGGKD